MYFEVVIRGESVLLIVEDNAGKWPLMDAVTNHFTRCWNPNLVFVGLTGTALCQIFYQRRNGRRLRV